MVANLGRTDPVPLELKSDYMGLGRFQMEVGVVYLNPTPFNF